MQPELPPKVTITKSQSKLRPPIRSVQDGGDCRKGGYIAPHTPPELPPLRTIKESSFQFPRWIKKMFQNPKVSEEREREETFLPHIMTETKPPPMKKPKTPIQKRIEDQLEWYLENKDHQDSTERNRDYANFLVTLNK